MNTINPFEDAPAEKRPPAPIASREVNRIARQVAAEANAGRSSYTMGMLIIVTISCAAILGVCGTSLQDTITSDSIRQEALPYIIAGVVVGIPFGIIVALFVRISTPTIFLGGMMGGLVGALTTPAALNAKESPTKALAAAALMGPALILVVSYVFAHLSRRTSSPSAAPAPSSPWDPLPAAVPLTGPAAEISSPGEEEEDSEAAQERAAVS
jgi:hypothetical protein